MPTIAEMPNPTPAMRESPEFAAVWDAIKSWDVNAPQYYEGYCAANGSHVAIILEALWKARAEEDGVEVQLQGTDVDGGEVIEVAVRLHDVPREGDQLAVWVGGMQGEAYLIVDKVFWPTWTYEHVPHDRTPRVYVRRDEGFSDEEFREMFDAIKEGRRP